MKTLVVSLFTDRMILSFFMWAGAPSPVSIDPVMTHQAWARYDSEVEAEEALVNLDETVSVSGEK